LQALLNRAAQCTTDPRKSHAGPSKKVQIGGTQPARFLVHDRDSCYGTTFDRRVRNIGIAQIRTPFRSPRANAIAERWVRSVRTASLDWASYPILTFPEVPQIVIDLIDRPNAPPWGAGEPAAAVVPSAISNAVFDATGVRLRSVPFTPDKMKSASRAA
jgi:transposase InsO family protein